MEKKDLLSPLPGGLPDVGQFTTGLPGLDAALQGLLPGDNVVWQVDTVDEYAPFVEPFWEASRRQGRKLIYFRFARHRELLRAPQGGTVYRLRPEDGFERFVTEILDVAEKAGPGACYVFDWLSDLAADWYSDHMLGNFFMITCPFLYKLETIAYFGLRKNQHSSYSTEPITNTAQVIIDVYRRGEQLFIHPQKVWQRHSPTLYLIHAWDGDEFRPVTNSALITSILSNVPHPWLDFSVHRLGIWTRLFRQAQATLNAVRNGKKSASEADAFFRRLVKMVFTRDERFGELVRQYFELADIIEVMKRMIGSGLVGGKTLGMLLARAIIRKKNPRLAEKLEAHDSFFIGSDVFYTYLVQNGCWWLRRKQRDFDAYLKGAEEARQKILTGKFPDHIQDQFLEMLEYFGQSPIIVRSSSLLEDNYGNAFSGKYESVFCANQGTPEERLHAFMDAVRTVYASTLSPEGLNYRRHHGLLDYDEQMALLVQRVSGEMYGHTYFPQLAGVGFSFNPFVWTEDIDPRAGVIRLVFGLGTRAVERVGDDYTRIVALNAPLKRPDARGGDGHQYCQRKADLLDLQANKLVSRDVDAVLRTMPANLVGLFANPRTLADGESPRANDYLELDFDRLLAESELVQDLRQMLAILEEAYSYPVDVEFAANFISDRQFSINLLQCRPFQVKIRGRGDQVRFPSGLRQEQKLLESSGPIIGPSLACPVNRFIYVVPSAYARMTMSQRYSVARTIGRLTHLPLPEEQRTILLAGPGRWCTSMPSLGVPVAFAEIENVSIICELALMHEGLIPDISLGTHFFNDLVELNMLYLAVTPGKDGNLINEAQIKQLPNSLTQLLPGAAAMADAIRVVDSSQIGGASTICLNADVLKQRALCYLAATPA